MNAFPQLPLSHLDQIWFQAGGTLCNLTCRHCFISCSPHNRNFGFLSLSEVERRLEEAVALGVNEFYFTGGEPFLNPELTDMLEATLRVGPATVLTNATVLRAEWLRRLAAAECSSPYSLEFRVSLDGFSAATNDPLRGEGVFERTLRGIVTLVEHEFLPIITAARVWPDEEEPQIVAAFVAMLQSAGYARPRLKILPRLQLGAEAQRTCGYTAADRLTADMLHDFDTTQLVCEHSRLVSDRGVHVCPILIESPDSLMGQSLADSLRPFTLAHGACVTCYQYGAICTNASTSTAGRVSSSQ